MTQITTFLMFSGENHGKAEAAVNFYVSQFEDGRIEIIERHGAGSHKTEGTVLQAVFSLNGQQFKAMDSAYSHQFNFTPSMSLFVTCQSEEEIDRLFETFSESGQVLMPLDNYGFSKRFAWVNDRFGVSWQFNLPA